MSDSDEGAEGEPRRRGRPPGAKGSFTFRMTSVLRAQLEETAAAANRTLGEEVETRLEQSFWAVAMKAHEKLEFERFSADAYLKRLEVQCGGASGLSFSVGLGDLMRRLRMKLGIDREAEVIDLPEDQRRALLSELLAILPMQFSVWDDAATDAAATLLGLAPKEPAVRS